MPPPPPPVNNKKKKTRQPKDTGRSPARDTHAKTMTTPRTTSPPIPSIWKLSRPQLTCLIVVSFGLARLLQIGQSYQVDKSPTAAQAKQVCLDHLVHSDACTDAGLQSLLRAKYFLGLDTAAIVMIVMRQAWHEEALLQKLVTCLGVIVATVATVLYQAQVQDIVRYSAAWQHIRMCVVFLALSVPTSWSDLPFVGSRRPRVKTMQTMTLLTCALLGSFLAAHWALDGDNTLNSVMNVPLHQPATSVVRQLLALDLGTQAVMFLFSWHYLPEAAQRNVLLLTGLLGGLAYFVAVPVLATHLKANAAANLYGLAVGMAGAGLLGGLAPRITWGGAKKSA